MDNLQDKLNEFDSETHPRSEQNIEAARQRGLTYDFDKQAYVDSEGCLILDKFGQPF